MVEGWWWKGDFERVSLGMGLYMFCLKRSWQIYVYIYIHVYIYIYICICVSYIYI